MGTCCQFDLNTHGQPNVCDGTTAVRCGNSLCNRFLCKDLSLPADPLWFDGWVKTRCTEHQFTADTRSPLMTQSILGESNSCLYARYHTNGVPSKLTLQPLASRTVTVRRRGQTLTITSNRNFQALDHPGKRCWRCCSQLQPGCSCRSILIVRRREVFLGNSSGHVILPHVACRLSKWCTKTN